MIAVLAALALLAPGDHDLTFTHAGGPRTYIVRVPSRAAERAPMPVILAFHGGGGNAAGFKKYAGLDAIADREGVLVVYPDGTGPLARRLLTWNAGACCGYAQSHNVDDVGFALAILADLARDMPLDPTRVYATGHSNGAMMAYRLAIEASERIAAIAPVAGMMVSSHFPPKRPVPVLHVHSVDDPRAVYTGGLGPPFPGTSNRVQHSAVEPGLRRWAAFDGCPAEPRGAEQREGSRRRDAGHTATLLVWAPCVLGVEVAFWRLTGAGHGWPGGKSPLPEELMGPNTKVINAADEVWKFLRRFTRQDAPAIR